jgi:Flp pilus assembly protein TadD
LSRTPREAPHGEQAPDPRQTRHGPWAPHVGALVVLLAVAAACCLPAIDAPFTHDERAGIAENRALRPGSPIGAAVTYRFSPDQARPVFFLSLWADARLFGVRPRPFRLTGLALHLICGVLVYLLLKRLPRPEGTGIPSGAALAGTAFFLLHPLQAESVIYIWGRSGVLSTLFILAALLLVPWAVGTAGRRLAAWAGAIACTTLGLTSKEETVVLPLIAFLWWTIAEGRPVRSGLRRAAILAVPVAAFLLVRSLLVGGVGRQVFARSLTDNILGQAAVTLRMVRLVLLPAGQSFDHAVEVPGPAAGSLALAGCAIVVAAASLLAARPHPGTRRLGGGILVAASGCLLYWIVPLPDLMSERRLYLPFAGAALCVSGIVTLLAIRVAANRSPRAARVASLLPAAILALLLGPAVHLRARVHADPRLLWEEAARLAPHKARPLVNLGVMAAERGDRDKAGEMFGRAVSLEPANAEALYNRGKLRLDAGDVQGAAVDLSAAVSSNPGMPRARINLAIARIRLNDLPGAEADLRAALDIDPDEPRALTNLAEVLRATGRTAEALPLYRRALSADPTYAHAAVRLGVALEALGDRDGALAAYREYLRRGPPIDADRDAVLKKVESLSASLLDRPSPP